MQGQSRSGPCSSRLSARAGPAPVGAARYSPAHAAQSPYRAVASHAPLRSDSTRPTPTACPPPCTASPPAAWSKPAQTTPPPIRPTSAIDCKRRWHTPANSSCCRAQAPQSHGPALIAATMPTTHASPTPHVQRPRSATGRGLRLLQSPAQIQRSRQRPPCSLTIGAACSQSAQPSAGGYQQITRAPDHQVRPGP